MNSDINPIIDIGRLVAAGVVGGLVATFAGHRLTVIREGKSGKAKRKTDFLAFMQQWRHEIDRFHLVIGGRERKKVAFYDGVSSFCIVAETIRNDFYGESKTRFVGLVNTITKHGKLEYGYNHEELIKTIDEIMEMADKN